MSLLELVTASLESKFDDLKVIRAKRQARISSAYSEANNRIEPTTDRYGRLHAPCDGYEDIDGRGVYGKGEFLPIPDFVFEQLEREGITCDRGNGVFGQSVRIMMTVEEYNELSPVFTYTYGLKCSSGRAFEKAGVMHQYMYVKGNDALIKAIEGAKTAFIEGEKEARRANKGKAPTGRQTLAAKILHIRITPPLCSWDEPSIKMLVELENKATAWGTVPKALGVPERGDEVTIKATFKPSDSDDTHAFFSRPVVA